MNLELSTIQWGAVASAVLLGFTFFVLLILQRVGPTRARSEETTSPVPWIADSVWRRLYRPLGAHRVAPRPVVVRPELIAVEDSDRERAPTLARAANERLPPAGALEAQRRRLLQLKGSGGIHAPVWPVCCERLATLISAQGGKEVLDAIESQAGPLDRAFLDAELRSWGGPEADVDAFRRVGWSDVLAGIRRGEHTGQGVNIFHCRACERVYVASCAP